MAMAVALLALAGVGWERALTRRLVLRTLGVSGPLAARRSSAVPLPFLNAPEVEVVKEPLVRRPSASRAPPWSPV